MDTAVALVGAYLRLNGYATIPEEPILKGEGRPVRYRTATDVDILAVRFPRAAVVIPRAGGRADGGEEDLCLAADPLLALEEDAVDVIIGEVKSGRPRLNEALRDPEVLLAALRRLDAGFDRPLERCARSLIVRGVAANRAAGRRWRFRLVAFGDGDPVPDGGPFTVVPLRHVGRFLADALATHRAVWRDAQFGDPVLDLLHLLDHLGLLCAGPEPGRGGAGRRRGGDAGRGPGAR